MESRRVFFVAQLLRYGESIGIPVENFQELAALRSSKATQGSQQLQEQAAEMLEKNGDGDGWGYTP